jgi:hypothetical protein
MVFSAFFKFITSIISWIFRKEIPSAYVKEFEVAQEQLIEAFSGKQIKIGYPFITEYKLGNTHFRLTSNDLYYNDYMNPTMIKSMVKTDNKIKIELDLEKVRDCSISRHIIIDILTKEIIYNIISHHTEHNVTEIATLRKMKFEQIS